VSTCTLQVRVFLQQEHWRFTKDSKRVGEGKGACIIVAQANLASINSARVTKVDEREGFADRPIHVGSHLAIYWHLGCTIIVVTKAFLEVSQDVVSGTSTPLFVSFKHVPKVGCNYPTLTKRPWDCSQCQQAPVQGVGLPPAAIGSSVAKQEIDS
jgi:hypothetical protein